MTKVSFIHSLIFLTSVRKVRRKLQLYFLINTDLKQFKGFFPQYTNFVLLPKKNPK